MRFFRTPIGSSLIAIAIVALCPFFILENAQALESASFQLQTQSPDWRPPITGTNFQITFTAPDDQVASSAPGGIAKFYRPPAPPPPPPPAPAPSAPAAAPAPVAPAAPVAAPVVTPTPVTAPVVKAATPVTSPAPVVNTKAPVMINGIPQRYAAPAPAAVPAPAPVPVKAAPVVPAPTKSTVTAPAAPTPATIPINQITKPTLSAPPITAPGSVRRATPAAPLQVPQEPAGKTSPNALPPAKTSSTPLAQRISARLDQRLRERSIAFGASLLMDGNGDMDPVRSGLLALCLFLVVLLAHTRRRLRLMYPSLRTQRRVGRGPFTSRRIRP